MDNNIQVKKKDFERARWPTDGENFGVIKPDSIIVTPEVDRFLKEDRVFIVCASKGMGKTLFLRYKKELLETLRHDGQVIIPSNSPMDYVFLPRDIKWDFLPKLSDPHYWQGLWELSIILSTLTHTPLQNTNAADITALRATILRIRISKMDQERVLDNIDKNIRHNIAPSSFLVSILSGREGAFSEFRNRIANELMACFQRCVRHGVYVFIDSFDQELKSVYDNNDVWNAGQHGLILAAFEMHRRNNHVKAYVSVRQEAYALFSNQNSMAMKAHVLNLKYTSEELRDMFEKAVHVYEDGKTIEQFLGGKNIMNQQVNTPEDSFEYLYRHTNYTPRSLMSIGGDISRKSDKVTSPKAVQNRVREVVNNTSTEIMHKDYLMGEMKEFLTTLNSAERINAFFQLINKNILTYDNLASITEAFKRSSAELDNDHTHPFCDLYNIGILGVVSRDHLQKKAIQKFKSPQDFNWDREHILPKDRDKIFLIHPGLNLYLADRNDRYSVHPGIIVGNERPWLPGYDERLRKNSLRIFFSYSHDDFDRVKKVAARIRDEMNLRCMYYSSFLDRWDIRAGEGVTKTIIDEVRRCNFLIFCVSSSSLRSDNVQKEWLQKYEEEASSNKVRLINVMLNDKIHYTSLPEQLRDKMSVLIEDDNQDGINRLIEDLLHHNRS